MRKAGSSSIAAIVTIAALGTALFASRALAEGGGHGACRADIEKLCPDAKRGDGSIRTCLQDHEADLSDACKEAIARRRAHHGHKAGGSGTDANGGGSGTDSGSGGGHESNDAGQ